MINECELNTKVSDQYKRSPLNSLAHWINDNHVAKQIYGGRMNRLEERVVVGWSWWAIMRKMRNLKNKSQLMHLVLGSSNDLQGQKRHKEEDWMVLV